ncbi:matrixin family metalloprotease [Acinetobacter vivianii]|uniref:matrixin family metalloprotease n=1 Tax=Acinetobacter vivianii TaxID=1776742 RepID=UPI002DBE2E57|nr:matrixin family metalloprotease [Acinetobacter vivianii]MEB6481434.1 M10 family metallopeptidase domain-containing protein [Acinetobacter vivianii]MEB6659748.1 M10 family metallopeptidase domain-containing protein [Acinetobacter vivianii]
MHYLGFAMIAACLCMASPHLTHAQNNTNLVDPHQHQTLKKTLHYRIADIDPRFHLSQQQVLELTQQAAKIWEHETGQQNFIYDPEAEFSINLVFDERQQRSTDRVQSLQQLQQDQQQWKDQNQQLQHMKAEIQQSSALIAHKQAQLNSQFQQYNQDVQRFNQQRSSSKALADQFTQRQAALQQQSLALQQEIQQHNQRTRQLNQDIQSLNQNNQQLVASANQFNQIFQPRLFHKGHFNGKHIMIYEFSSTNDLRLTLAHEFGHALGLAHTDDPSSLMYPIIQQQNLQKFALTDSDKDLVKAMY